MHGRSPIPPRDCQSWPFVIPGHRADFPASWGCDELDGDHATAINLRPSADAMLVIDAQPMGYVAEYLGNFRNFGLLEAQYFARIRRLLTRLDELADSEDLGRRSAVLDDVPALDEEII